MQSCGDKLLLECGSVMPRFRQLGELAVFLAPAIRPACFSFSTFLIRPRCPVIASLWIFYGACPAACQVCSLCVWRVLCHQLLLSAATVMLTRRFSSMAVRSMNRSWTGPTVSNVAVSRSAASSRKLVHGFGRSCSSTTQASSGTKASNYTPMVLGFGTLATAALVYKSDLWREVVVEEESEASVMFEDDPAEPLYEMETRYDHPYDSKPW